VQIAITGGSGFIGAATLAAAQASGHTAWSVDRELGFDVMDFSLEEGLKGADSVIHLAGLLGTSELFDRPEEAVAVNVLGTVRVLKWCERNNAGYVGITMPDSSWANVYQATKLAATRLASAWHRNRGVPVAHVRAFNAYGPGQKFGPGHPQKILPTFAIHAWHRIPLPIFGNGLQTADLVHVQDVARMLVDATGFEDDEVFDAGTGTSVTVRSFARFVNRVAQAPEHNLDFLPMRAGEEEETSIQATGQGWDKLGWKPELDWDLVTEAVQWYRNSAI
jgi:UDP-glucose 4-epimerase